MKELLLEFLFNLAVSAASGIHCQGEDVYIIGDNSGFVYHHNLEQTTFSRHPLYDGATDITPKKLKRDLESAAFLNGKLYIFGSGSKKKRETGYIFDIESQKSTAFALNVLYGKLRAAAGLDPDDLNIEGAVFYKKELLLFQRGNGLAARNGIFRVKGKDKFSADAEVVFTEVKLPQIEGVTATFTDAVAVKDKIYFLAAAEGSDNTYDDGTIYGTLAGILDAKSLQLLETAFIGKGKYEGIALYKEHKSTIEFLVCEDNDKNQSEGAIYRLILSK